MRLFVTIVSYLVFFVPVSLSDLLVTHTDPLRRRLPYEFQVQHSQHSRRLSRDPPLATQALLEHPGVQGHVQLPAHQVRVLSLEHGAASFADSFDQSAKRWYFLRPARLGSYLWARYQISCPCSSENLTIVKIVINPSVLPWSKPQCDFQSV